MKILLIIICLTASLASHGQKKNSIPKSKSEIDSLKRQLIHLEGRSTDLQSKYDELQTKYNDLKGDQQSQESKLNNDHTILANQISILSISLAIVGVILTIAGFVGGAWVSRKVDQMSFVGTEIEKYKNYIESNLYGLNDELQQREALQLLNKVRLSPRQYSTIYDRLSILNLPPSFYKKFTDLIDVADSLRAEDFNIDPQGVASMGTDPTRPFRISTYYLLLKVFPKQVFYDREIVDVFRNEDLFYELSHAQRVKCIEAIYQVVSETSIEAHLPILKRVALNLQYDEKLYAEFVRIFSAKLDELRAAWPTGYFTQPEVDGGVLQKLNEYHLI
ncbi:MAG: hypothetical protein C0490_03360 [Marivirga sp.]|nr:hypothetical protein [Marivirga sp.]